MITIWNNNKNNNNSYMSEISKNNILNYKRRSKLISKVFYNDDKTVINEMETLKNCYNYLYDLKNILSDYISLVKRENRKFSKLEENILLKKLEDSKTEIISASNIYKNYKDKNKITYTLKQKRDLNKMNKKIIDISNIVILLSNDITRSYGLVDLCKLPS